MKKIIVSLMLFGLLSSCEEFQNTPEFEESIESLLTVKTTTNLIGVFQNFNVEEVVFESTPSFLSFKFKSNSVIGIDGMDFDLSNLSYFVKNGRFFLDKNPDIYISLKAGNPVIWIDDKFHNLKEIPKKLMNGYSQMLILGFIELSGNPNNKIKFSPSTISNRIQCSFFGTYYLTAVNISNSTTLAELESGIASGGYNAGCSKIGGIDVSCAFDSHYCVATQAYCCD